MNFDTTIRELEQERELINLAITAVQNARDNRVGHTRTTNRATNVTTTATPGTGKRRHLTAAAKKLISDKMKQKWAARKAATDGKKPELVGRGKKAA